MTRFNLKAIQFSYKIIISLKSRFIEVIKNIFEKKGLILISQFINTFLKLTQPKHFIVPIIPNAIL